MSPDTCQAVGLKFEADREFIPGVGTCALCLTDLAINSKQVLDVMTNFVSQNIRLCEISGGPKAVSQFIVEPQIDIDLLISRAIEGTGGRFGESTRRSHSVAKQHELRIMVGNPFGRRKELLPCALVVIQNERNELDQGLLSSIARWIWLTYGTDLSCGTAE